MKQLITAILFACFAFAAKAQTFYDLNTIQDIRIYFSYSNWDYRLDTSYAGAGEYIAADSVVINGTALLNCGVRYKGNSSYDPARIKNPLHIKLDEYVDQNYQGYEDVKLGNGYSDNSMLREPLSFNILRNYMDAPKSNFARVYINGSYYGVMNNTESIDANFLLDNYYSSSHTFVKCNPPGSPGVGSGSNLGYNGNNVSSYNTVYELKSDTGWSELFQLCDTLNNHFSQFDSIADIDRFIWMLAFNNALVNLDSYSGTFRQNYYLYRNHADQWIPTVWDLNMSFGGFAIAGGTTSSLTPATMQTMSYTLHKNESGWPLIYKLLNDAFYTKMYYAHLRTINNENFATAGYKATANSLHGLIDSLVVNDVNYLGAYADFQKSLDSNTTIIATGGACPGIFPLMDARAAYLSNVLSAAPPVISNVSSGSGTLYGASTIISAQVTNSTAVYLGYRYNKADRFTRVPMYDDGGHGDGAANDNVFGASITLSSLSVQYYIYAENASTGAFSPERAEHEFYSITPTITNATGNQIVLNEVTANNSSGIENETGKHKDWVEVYNSTNFTLGLSGLYLTDLTSDLTRWNFPSKAMIEPGEHLLIWADDLDKTYLDLHTNFNFNSLGDALLLTDGTNILDSISFGEQAIDQTIGRCADGSGAFRTLVSQTPRAVNDCSTGIPEVANMQVLVYPNPSSDVLYISADKEINTVALTNAVGQLVVQHNAGIGQSLVELNVSELANGIYTVSVNGHAYKKLVVAH